MNRIRVLIVEDHTIFRLGLRRACESRPDIEVVGESQNGLEAIAACREHNPDVVLMDINMPVLDGVEAARRIGEEYPQIGILMLTVVRDDTHIAEALLAGASGYLLKDSDEKFLLEGIYKVARGESLIDSETTARILDEYRQSQPTSNFDIHPATLTHSEMEILRRLAKGEENTVIADALELSEKTVVNRLTTIYQKLHVSNRTQAVLYALRKGWASVRINL